ncbi:MAG TPA: YceI family protein [Terriglobales bacterium]|jgi:polyisoprenoid-binding protein YceI|nr:YceI family protein [Terriglobales bacterium]
MPRLWNAVLILFAILGIPASIFPATSDEPGKPEAIQIEHATATFQVGTNMPGLFVKGKSEALQARVQIRRSPDGVTLEHIEAQLPVKTLATGIALRDQHMREHVFTTPDGQVPDMTFEGEGISCPGILPGHEGSCRVSGTLSIRGTARNFSVLLKIREAGSAPAFRAVGDGVVKLSDYGIEQPSQFGVKTENEIQFRIEFPETTATALTTQAGRQ